MNKFFGKIGLATSVEDPVGSGIFIETIVEKPVYGDLVRDLRRLQNRTQLNDDITISNSFSIVADKYAYTYYHNIRYVEYMGVKWKAESVDATNAPRLIIDVSGVYNA